MDGPGYGWSGLLTVWAICSLWIGMIRVIRRDADLELYSAY